MVSRYSGWNERSGRSRRDPATRARAPMRPGPRSYLLMAVHPLGLRQHGHNAVQAAVDQVRLRLPLQRRLQGAEPRVKGPALTQRGPPAWPPSPWRKGYAR